MPPLKLNGSERLPVYLPANQDVLLEQPKHFWRNVRVGALIAGMIVGRYAHNVAEGRAEHLADNVAISHVFDASDPAKSNIMIFAFDGLTGRDAYDSASAEIAYAELGSMEAINYAKDVSPEPIVNAIIKKANTAGIYEIGMSTLSTGGPIALDAEAVIIKRSEECKNMGIEKRLTAEKNNYCPKFKTVFIGMDSAPAGIDSVRPDKLTHKDQIAWAAAHIPGIQDSTDANFTVQSIGKVLNKPSIVDFKRLVEAPYYALKFNADINSNKKASPSLLLNEFDAISAVHIQSNLETIGAAPDDERPVIMLMQPSDPARDQTLLSAVAMREYTDLTTKYDITFVPERIDGTVHANPGYKPEAWNTGVRQQVIPDVLRAISNQKLEARLEIAERKSLDNPPYAGDVETSDGTDTNQVAEQAAPAATPPAVPTR